MRFLVIALLAFLVAAGSLNLFATIYPLTALILTIHIWTSKNGGKTKAFMTLIYLSIMVVQLIFITLVVFSGVQTGILFELKRIIAVCLIMAPFFALYMNYLYAVQKRFFPAVQDASAVSFQMMKEACFKAGSVKNTIVKSKNTLNPDSLAEIARDIPRHSYTKYLNKGTLTEDFFRECESSLDDEHIYVVLSCTGSSSSELISLFTRKEYNHVSLSFDRELLTILSYNGGENVYPPGLNREYLDYFNRKKDASMLIYCLDAPKDKKRMVLEKIKEINRNGSAYNLVGLVTKVSVRPNIMFCSQFVYSILRYAGLVYFTEKAACVKPSDLIERDYYRKLKFCYEIKFRDMETGYKFPA
jgi:hypothetical protein